MTRDEAEAEAARRQADDPQSTWTVREREGVWAVVRIGLPHQRASGTATKPPPEVVPEFGSEAARELGSGRWG